jgi:hypothetical protein
LIARLARVKPLVVALLLHQSLRRLQTAFRVGKSGEIATETAGLDWRGACFKANMAPPMCAIFVCACHRVQACASVCEIPVILSPLVTRTRTCEPKIGQVQIVFVSISIKILKK